MTSEETKSAARVPWKMVLVFCAGYWTMLAAPIDAMYAIILLTLGSIIVLAAKHGKRLAGDSDV